MYKKTLLFTCLATFLTTFVNEADASLIMVIRDHYNPDIVVIDNQNAGFSYGGWTSTVADANMTLGSAVFNGSYGQYGTVNLTAQSKPELPLNEMDLGGVVRTQQTDTSTLTVMALDVDFVGSSDRFLTQTGGTNDGDFGTSSWVNSNNNVSVSDFDNITWSPYFTPANSPFSWSDMSRVSHASPFALAVQATLAFNAPGTTSFDTNLKQISAVPEPTTALVWSMFVGVGLVVRRRR